MKKTIMFLFLAGWLCAVTTVQAQESKQDTTEVMSNDLAAPEEADSAMSFFDDALADDDIEGQEAGGGLHKQLKRKFMEGTAGFMSLVALALVLGLAFCIERIVYLTLSEINARRFMNDLDARLQKDDVEGAKALCRDTRGPVASICYQGLLHIKEPLEQIDRQLTNYGQVQVLKMEKGCTTSARPSWPRV